MILYENKNLPKPRNISYMRKHILNKYKYMYRKNLLNNSLYDAYGYASLSDIMNSVFV